MRSISSLKKTLSIALRLALAFGIIFYLLHKIDMQALTLILRESLSQWEWLIAGIVLSYLALHAGMIRWSIILDAQGLEMSAKRCFSVYFIGQFFNSFMFGSTGGDLIRAFYAAKETHHKKTEAVATVFIDRMIGLIALYLIAAIMLTVRVKFFLSQWETHLPALIMIGMILATMVALIVVFNINRFANWPLVDRIKRHPTLGRTIKRVLISIYLYRRRTGVLIRTSLLSLLIQALTVTQCYCIGRCFQINIGVVDYLTVIPIIISIAAIPITPGGLGIREGLAVTLLGAMGVNSAQSLPLSLMIFFISVAWSLVGGVIFMGYSASSGHTVHEEMVELEHETESEDGEEGIPSAHEQDNVIRTCQGQ